jgi:hypothetical protein
MTTQPCRRCRNHHRGQGRNRPTRLWQRTPAQGCSPYVDGSMASMRRAKPRGECGPLTVIRPGGPCLSQRTKAGSKRLVLAGLDPGEQPTARCHFGSDPQCEAYVTNVAADAGLSARPPCNGTCQRRSGILPGSFEGLSHQSFQCIGAVY